ncbi:hypothetical protein PENTCL1PPCAC_28766, partial [Pristionchus entomophagus]
RRMLRIRSPPILEPRISGYPLTLITKCIISFQTFILTGFLLFHIITMKSIGKGELIPEDYVRLGLHAMFITSIVLFFMALRYRQWTLILPIIVLELSMLFYLIWTIVDLIQVFYEPNPKYGLIITYIVLCLMVIAEAPLTVFLSIRVLLYMRTMARAVRTTRQLSYVGSITKESLRKEEEMVRMQTIKRREREESRREPRISVISLPLEDREPPAPPSSPHIEVSDA